MSAAVAYGQIEELSQCAVRIHGPVVIDGQMPDVDLTPAKMHPRFSALDDM